jgi:nucleobase transporter 1/2
MLPVSLDCPFLVANKVFYNDYYTYHKYIQQHKLYFYGLSIIVASITQVVIGCTGILGVLLQYIGPITVVPTITLVGLSLIDVALSFCKSHWGVSFL